MRSLTLLLLLLPTLAGAQDLVLNGGSHTLGGVQTYDNVTITGGATVLVTPFDGTAGSTGSLRFNVTGTFTLDAGSTINGDGRGYRPQTNTNGEGPGGGQGGSCCADGGGGGAYGGSGGRGTLDNGSQSGGVGGNAYGDANAKQLFMGSAGGSAGTADGDSGGGGGAGGASVWIDAATAVVAGTIRVNGTNGAVVAGDAAGGGAGGGILIDADNVTISGALLANGGSGANVDDDGGGGGGGRIKIFYGTLSLPGSLSVGGGNGPGNAGEGGAGSTAQILENLPPVASISAAATADEGAALAVDGSGSTDSDGSIVAWNWDCDADGGFDDATGVTASCTWPDGPAATSVGLQVTDDLGSTGSTTVAVTVANVAPAGSALVIPSGDELALLDFSVVATDVAADTVTVTWDFGDGSPTALGDAVQHTYDEDGAYSVTATLADEDGGSTVLSGTATIGNASPVLLPGTAPNGDEGQLLAFAAPATDGGQDPLTWSWDFGDGTPLEAGESPSHTFADEGSYSVVVVVTDDDGGSATRTDVVTIANVAPSVDSLVLVDGDEAELLALSATVSDPGDDTLTVTWDFGDGSPAGTGLAVSHAWADEGVWTVTVTVDDGDGGSTSASGPVTTANTAPSVDSLTLMDGDEGELLTFVATGSDVADALTWTWDFGDGSPLGTGDSVDHAFADDGVYTVTATADDGTTTASSSGTAVIDNVAPAITSTPVEVTTQGSLWSYLPTADEPGADVLTWSLTPTAPAAMAVDPTSGEVSWVPGSADVSTTPYAFSLRVQDDDGGFDLQPIALVVAGADTDGDGIPDDWETDHGLDPSDPADAAGDPDGDNLSNLDEFLGDTDPHVFDGPSAPTPLSPIGVDAPTLPTLLVANAIDPNGDALNYEFEVYDDAALTSLVAQAIQVAEEPAETSWKLTIPLAENSEAWWRARASDAHVAGAWSTVESLFVNDGNEPPSVPTPVFPVGGEEVTTTSNALVWSASTDPEGDDVAYTVEVEDDGPIWGDDTPFDGSTELALEFTPTEETDYRWRVRAVDGDGAESAWSDWADFRWNDADGAPFGVEFVEPLDGDVVGLQPRLVATAGTDPEGGALTYEFAVDVVATFDSADLIEVGGSDATVDLADEGVELMPGTDYWARVQAFDPGGTGSAADVVQFRTEADLLPLPVPTLLAPADGAVLESAWATLVVATEAPLDRPVLYEFRFDMDPNFTDATVSPVVAPGAGPLGDATRTSWALPAATDARTHWSARTVDPDGNTSDWAAAWTFEPPAAIEIPEPDPGPVVYTGGLGSCRSSVAPAGSPLLLLLLAWRRRR